MGYAQVLTALADPTRRQIFEALRTRPQTVGDLASAQPVSRPAVSQHLRVLAAAHLVSVEPRGSRRVYAIRRDGLGELRSYLDGFWPEVLSAYGAAVAKGRSDKRKGRK